jgi:putative phage-type endonuclease
MSDAPETIVCTTRAEWLAARRLGIGSSDAAAILGHSPFASPFQVYASKLGADDDGVETEEMRWGSRLEPVVADAYAHETQRALRDPGRFTVRRSSVRPFMLATLDREIVDPVCAAARGSFGVLEIKCTGFYRAEDWQEEPPLHVQIQAQWQLAVMGWCWASVAVLIGGNRFLWTDLERNERFIALAIERAGEFWARVEKLVPPPPGARDVEAIAQLYRRDSGATITLPEDFWDVDRVYAEALAQLKHFDTVKREAEARIKGAMASATVAKLPGGAVEYRWPTIERKGFTVEPTSYRRFERRETDQ